MKTKKKIKRCKICGRKLKDSLSIERGMGEVCYKKHLKEKRKKLV